MFLFYNVKFFKCCVMVGLTFLLNVIWIYKHNLYIFNLLKKQDVH
jgi:hypothetical protein